MSPSPDGETTPPALLAASLWTRLAALEAQLAAADDRTTSGAAASDGPESGGPESSGPESGGPSGAQLKTDIYALFKEVEQASTTLAEVSQRIRGLASEWTARYGSRREAPAPARVDHLSASTYIEKGWSRLATDDLPGAISALEQALVHAPTDVEAGALLGWARAWHGDTAAAERLLAAVVRHAPEDPLARTALGFLRLATQRLPEACTAFTEALRGEGSPKATLYAHLGMGMALAARGAIDEAEAAFASALALGPNLVQGWYARGEALWQAGRVEAARAAWQAGAQGSRFTPWTARCAARLAGMAGAPTPSP